MCVICIIYSEQHSGATISAKCCRWQTTATVAHNAGKQNTAAAQYYWTNFSGIREQPSIFYLFNDQGILK